MQSVLEKHFVFSFAEVRFIYSLLVDGLLIQLTFAGCFGFVDQLCARIIIEAGRSVIGFLADVLLEHQIVA